MRYIIIPLAVILYIWWTYKAVKNLKNKTYTNYWRDAHITFIGGWVLFEIVCFICKHW